MFGIGMPEMLLILAVALIVIGPKKLPDLAKSLGRALGEFRRATTDLKDSIESETQFGEVKSAFKELKEDIQKPLDSPKPQDDRPSTRAPSQSASAAAPPASQTSGTRAESGAEPGPAADDPVDPPPADPPPKDSPNHV